MFNLIVEKIAAENGRVKRRIENLPFSKEKKKISTWNIVETKHRIEQNLAQIARNFTCSTKIEIEMLNHFSVRDRSDQKFKIKNCA